MTTLRLLLIPFFVLIATFWWLAPWHVQGQTAGPVSEQIEQQSAQLNPQGAVYDLHLTPSGDLLISDLAAEEIWRVNPSTSRYTTYRQLGAVRDAQMDSSGAIWWTNGADTFGRIDPTENRYQTWQVSSEEQVQLLGLAFDESGRVWLTEWFGVNSKLYRFTPDNHELCAYTLPGGAYSYFVRYRAGRLWLVHWSANHLLQYHPDSQILTSWALGKAGAPEGLVLGEKEQAWWVDADNKTVNRFDPAINQVASYTVTAEADPHMLAFDPQRIWVSNKLSGTIESVDPLVAQAITATLSAITTTVSSTCQDLGIGASALLSQTAGQLVWQAETVTSTPLRSGQTVYQLPAGANPYGIISVDGALWIADQGSDRQKLVHLKIQSLNQVYLPIVLQDSN